MPFASKNRRSVPRGSRARRRSGYMAEALEARRLLAAAGVDLLPIAPAGWSDKIVISTGTGTNTDAVAITSADKLYIDTAIGNGGDSATDAQYVNRVLVDGVQAYTWSVDPPHNMGQSVSN